jgi:hypothetical protein
MQPQQQPLTEEQKERIDNFLKDYGELVQKYQVDFINFPILTPDEKYNWQLSVQTQTIDITDMKQKSSTVSPFIK